MFATMKKQACQSVQNVNIKHINCIKDRLFLHYNYKSRITTAMYLEKVESVEYYLKYH